MQLKLFETEPAVSIGVILTGIASAIVIALRAFNIWQVTPDQEAAVNGLIVALLAVPVLSGFITRALVTPVPRAESNEVDAYAAGYEDAERDLKDA